MIFQCFCRAAPSSERYATAIGWNRWWRLNVCKYSWSRDIWVAYAKKWRQFEFSPAHRSWAHKSPSCHELLVARVFYPRPSPPTVKTHQLFYKYHRYVWYYDTQGKVSKMAQNLKTLGSGNNDEGRPPPIRGFISACVFSISNARVERVMSPNFVSP